MHLRFSDDRILAVVAHPDDAELLCAGTLARAAADGAAIAICALCQGDKGQTTPRTENLVAVRQDELHQSAAIIGALVMSGGFPDSGLFDAPESREWLCAVMREFRPTLVLAHHPNDYHADHRAASALADAATWMSASVGYRGNESDSPSAHSRIADALARPPALWWMDTIGMHGSTPTLLIDISDFTGIKRAMLECHMTQLARATDTGFAPLVELMELQMSTRGMQGGVAAAEAFTPHAAFKRFAPF